MSEVVPSAGSGGPVDLIAEATAHFPTRPSWDEYFMATAVLMSTRSPCERLHVGCVIVSGGDRRNRLVAAGYNGFLPGTPHASRVRDGHEQATVHAEQNAVADAARRGSAVEGCVAYVTHFPCINCAKRPWSCKASRCAKMRCNTAMHNGLARISKGRSRLCVPSIGLVQCL
jgi:dCMP deaminase